MKTSVIRIGNSRGIRIPKTLLEQCRLRDEVELEVVEDHLVVRSATKPRSGWEDAFRKMHEQGDDVLLDQESLPATHWDNTEWQW
jgi:antitoxin MazE